MSNFLPSGEYYIENDATTSSLYLDGTKIKAKKRPKKDPGDEFKFKIVTDGTTSDSTIKNGIKYVATNPSAPKPGSEVVSSDTEYKWKITSVNTGRSFYSIIPAATPGSDGPVAMQLLSSNPKADTYVGSHVGTNTQQWIFDKV